MSDSQENRKGVTAAFATLTPFRNKLFDWWESLILVNSRTFVASEPTIRGRAFLHHAYWVKVPAQKRRGKGWRARSQARGSLLFMSYYTDGMGDYLRGFTEKLSTEMDLLWGPTQEWPGAKHYGKCLAFIDKYRRHTDVYFNGRGNLGVRNVRVALRTRELLDRLVAETGDDAAFLKSYEDAVQAAFAFDLMDPAFRGDEPRKGAQT